MKIVSFVFIIPAIRLFNSYDKILKNSKDSSNISTLSNKNNFLREKINIIMLVNKYKNINNYECFYCLGKGYVECDKCSKPLYCKDCDNIGLKICHICGGSGKGGPRCNFIPILDSSLLYKELQY